MHGHLCASGPRLSTSALYCVTSRQEGERPNGRRRERLGARSQPRRDRQPRVATQPPEQDVYHGTVHGCLRVFKTSSRDWDCLKTVCD